MEQTSRYSLRTAFLDVSDIPADKMARVMIYVQYFGKEDMTYFLDETKTRLRDPYVDEMKVRLKRDHFAQKSRLVCQAFASMHQSEGTITCLGAQFSQSAIALKEMLEARMKTTFSAALGVWCDFR
jgi:predicted aldo/keto reductase-like oxidoreductase